MWGAKVYQRRDLIEGLMRALVLSGQDQVGWKDQASLDMIVWPAAKFDVVSLKNEKNFTFTKTIFKIIYIYIF